MITSLKKFCLILLVSCAVPSVKPLSETTASIGAGVGGVLAGAAAGAGTYYLAFNDASNQTLRQIATSVASVGVGGLSAYLLYQWLYSMTPPGRLVAAEALVSNAEFDSLICNHFTTDQALASHVTARFGTSWPLVLGQRRYEAIMQNIGAARNLLNLIAQEIQGDGRYAYLQSRCGQLDQRITDIGRIIEPRINALTNNDKYDLQTQLYEKNREAERMREHERSLQTDKLWHDTMERSKDRWHENNKDARKYDHQNAILNQNQNRPVTLNIG